MRLTKEHIAILVFALLLFACTSPGVVQITNKDLIFQTATAIKVPPYSYTDNQINYTIEADSAFPNGIDTCSNRPVFKWDHSGIPFVVVVVFRDTIRNNENQILNDTSIVWYWHIGLDTDSDASIPGEVSFLDGRAYTDSEFNSTASLDSLDSNTKYMWGVWGWDEAAKRIKYSSKPYQIFVD
jgi:hypothetical protein